MPVTDSRSRARQRTNSSCRRNNDENLPRIRRTLTRTSPATFSGCTEIVPDCALASAPCRSTSSRAAADSAQYSRPECGAISCRQSGSLPRQRLVKSRQCLRGL